MPCRCSSAAGGLRRRGFLLLDQLTLDRDLNLLAHNEPAVQYRVEAEAEILPVDLGGGAVGDAVSHHPRVVELPVPRHVEDYGVGGLLNGQVAGQLEVVAGRFDAGALELDFRV